MGPGRFKRNLFTIGVKPIGSEGIAGAFEVVQWFPSCINLVLSFPVDQELSVAVMDAVIEDLFDFPMFFSLCIDGDRFWRSVRFESWEGLVVWSEVLAEVAAMDPRVDSCHDWGEFESVVVISVRAFFNGEWS
jgi:hypothetical protein